MYHLPDYLKQNVVKQIKDDTIQLGINGSKNIKNIKKA